MRKRRLARAVTFAMLLVVLAACGRPPVADNREDESSQWVERESYRPVKAFSVVSQPEIFYCSALGEEPDLSGVVFRLEYEDGGVEETSFAEPYTVRSIRNECSGSWLSYGMVLRTNPNPTLGKRREAVFFNNAQIGGHSSNEGGSFVTPVYEDNTELPRVYVDAYNLTVEEYLENFPLPILKPGAPVRLDIAQGGEERLVFTPKQDGVYLFRFAGGQDNEGCSLIILDSKGQLHGLNQYAHYGESAWSAPAHNVALRMRAGERIIMRCAFGYVYSEVKEGPLEASVTGPLKTHRLPMEKKVGFNGSCVVRPEVPGEGGPYSYRMHDAYAVPVDNLEFGFTRAYNVASPYPMPFIMYHNGERLPAGDWVIEAEGPLHPYTVKDTGNQALLSGGDTWHWNFESGTAKEFAMVAKEDAGAIELVRKKAPSMPGEFTLRVGETVPFSAFLTSDTMGTWNFTPLGGTKSTSVFSVFAQNGVLMLRGEKPGTVRLGASCYSKSLYTTITVTD